MSVLCYLSFLISVNSVLADADKLFEHELGALNMAALNRRVERAGLLSNLGPCCKALCARRDFAIRRQLLKNDKVDVRTINLILLFCVDVSPDVI